MGSSSSQWTLFLTFITFKMKVILPHKAKEEALADNYCILTVTEPKLVLLTTQQTNKLNDIRLLLY